MISDKLYTSPISQEVDEELEEETPEKEVGEPEETGEEWEEVE